MQVHNRKHASIHQQGLYVWKNRHIGLKWSFRAIKALARLEYTFQRIECTFQTIGRTLLGCQARDVTDERCLFFINLLTHLRDNEERSSLYWSGQLYGNLCTHLQTNGWEWWCTCPPSKDFIFIQQLENERKVSDKMVRHQDNVRFKWNEWNDLRLK